MLGHYPSAAREAAMRALATAPTVARLGGEGRTRDLASVAARHAGVLVGDVMRMGSRRRPVARARWAVWIVLYVSGRSLCQIADRWRCDHTTVMHGVQAGSALAQLCPDFAAMVTAVAAESERRAELPL